MVNPFAPIYSGTPERPQRDPSISETFGSMFRLGNDVVNILDLIGREETPPADPTFDYRQHFDDTMPEAWRPMLAESRSEGEFEQRLAVEQFGIGLDPGVREQRGGAVQVAGVHQLGVAVQQIRDRHRAGHSEEPCNVGDLAARLLPEP